MSKAHFRLSFDDDDKIGKRFAHLIQRLGVIVTFHYTENIVTSTNMGQLWVKGYDLSCTNLPYIRFSCRLSKLRNWLSTTKCCENGRTSATRYRCTAAIWLRDTSSKLSGLCGLQRFPCGLFALRQIASMKSGSIFSRFIFFSLDLLLMYLSVSSTISSQMISSMISSSVMMPTVSTSFWPPPISTLCVTRDRW